MTLNPIAAIRTRMAAKDESPWSEEFLSRLVLEVDAVRTRARKQRPLRRRRARREADGC